MPRKTKRRSSKRFPAELSRAGREVWNALAREDCQAARASFSYFRSLAKKKGYAREVPAFAKDLRRAGCKVPKR